jgi:hypothetical protein
MGATVLHQHRPQLNGELAVKRGQLTVLQQKHNQIKNNHTWTSAFINFMSIMLEKWPDKAHENALFGHVRAEIPVLVFVPLR